MKKRLALAVAFTAVSLYATTKTCYEMPKNAEISKKEIEVYKKSIPTADLVPDSAVRNDLLKNRLFAKTFLEQSGSIDEDTKIVINQAVEKALANLYMEKIKRENQPDEKALKSFYLDHAESFKPLTSVSISTIAVDSLKKADEIYLKLKKDPKLFEEIAKKESVDPAASNGGHYKDVPILKFAPAVREWIRKHKEGDISEPIMVGRYFYIDRIDKKSKTDTSYESLKSDIKKILVNAYLAERVKEEFKKLKEKEGIK